MGDCLMANEDAILDLPILIFGHHMPRNQLMSISIRSLRDDPLRLLRSNARKRLKIILRCFIQIDRSSGIGRQALLDAFSHGFRIAFKGRSSFGRLFAELVGALIWRTGHACGKQ